MMPIPPQAYLQECFSYDQLTGILMWMKRPLAHFNNTPHWKRWNAVYANKEAGSINKGYRVVSINGRLYKAHRLIFKLMTDTDPTHEVDHRNEHKDDNRWLNLRQATHQQNICNAGTRKKNKLGLKGVYFRVGQQKFVAQIRVHGKKKHLGSYATAIEAHQAYCQAASDLHGEFLNVG